MRGDGDRRDRDALLPGEETALLAARDSFEVQAAERERLPIRGSDPIEEEDGPVSLWPDHFLQEWWRLAQLAGPLAVQQLVVFSQSVITVAFVGRLGEFPLSVCVLSNSVFTATGLVTVMGIAGAMETLCGQAYGAKNFLAVGVIFQRALLICGLAIAVVLALWSQLQPLLLAFGQDPAIAAATAYYVLLCTPSLLLLGIAETGRRYLMAQNVVAPLAVIFTLGTLSTPLFNWLFIFHWRLGLTGSAVALSAINATNGLLLVGYIAWHNARLAGTREAPWPGWSPAAFRNWGQYTRIALPTLLMQCLEWWLFEAMINLSGLLKDPALSLATMGVLLNTIALVYTFPYSIGAAVSTRVANALGGGRPRAAANATAVSLITVLAGQAGFGLLMLLGRHWWARAFTSDAAVVRLAARGFPVVAATCLGDGVNAVMAGAIRGCGRQSYAAALNGFTYWLIGLPTALVLAFKLDLGVVGLWAGLMTAASVQAVAISALVLRLDWRLEARRAAEAMGKEAEAIKEEEPELAAAAEQPPQAAARV